MNMKEKTCCFTGHRQIPADRAAEIEAQLEEVITGLYRRGVRYYGAGGALGFDTMAALAVLRLRERCLGMKLILVLPCLSQTRGWRAEDVSVYEDIKARADKVVYTSREYFPGCMRKRDRHLVDHSEICVCYRTKDTGGTAYTADRAWARGLEVVAIR